MYDKLAREFLEPGLISNATGAIVVAERQRDRVLPTPSRILMGKDGTVDVRNQKWVDVNVVRMNGIGVILDDPFFGRSKRHDMLRITGILLPVDLNAALEIDHPLRQWGVVEFFELRRW